MKKFFNIFKDYDVLLLIICTAIVFLSNLIALEGFGLHEIIYNNNTTKYLLPIISCSPNPSNAIKLDNR